MNIEKLNKILKGTGSSFRRLAETARAIADTLKPIVLLSNKILLGLTPRQQYLALHGKRRIKKKWSNKYFKLVTREAKKEQK